MAINMIKWCRYTFQNDHKVPGLIHMTLIHTSNVSVTKLVIKLKHMRIMNYADKLEFQSTVAQIWNIKAQLFLPFGILVCQFEALYEKKIDCFSKVKSKLARYSQKSAHRWMSLHEFRLVVSCWQDHKLIKRLK